MDYRKRFFNVYVDRKFRKHLIQKEETIKAMESMTGQHKILVFDIIQHRL